MNHKSITPNPQQPVDRLPTGQLPNALAELSEAELNGDDGGIMALGLWCKTKHDLCSWAGDDE